MSKKPINKAAITTLTVISVLIVLLIAVIIIVNTVLNRIEREYDNDIPTIPPKDEFFESNLPSEPTTDVPPTSGATGTSEGTPIIDPDDIVWEYIDKIQADNLINILFVGQDRVDDQPRMHSDTMILCSINTETGDVSLISFLRDLYVQIPGGYSDNRLNVAYLYGGFPLMNETFSQNFGIEVDANFEVDFNGFTEIIDLVGGIEIEITKEEADYINYYFGLTDPEEQVKTGVNVLNGRYALMYSRIRQLDSDFRRTERQRKVMIEVIKKVKELNAIELISLMNKTLPYLTTNLINAEIISLVYELLPIMDSIKITTHHVPEQGTFYDAVIRGMWVLVPDLEVIREKLVNEYLPIK